MPSIHLLNSPFCNHCNSWDHRHCRTVWFQKAGFVFDILYNFFFFFLRKLWYTPEQQRAHIEIKTEPYVVCSLLHPRACAQYVGTFSQSVLLFFFLSQTALVGLVDYPDDEDEEEEDDEEEQSPRKRPRLSS